MLGDGRDGLKNIFEMNKQIEVADYLDSNSRKIQTNLYFDLRIPEIQ